MTYIPRLTDHPPNPTEHYQKATDALVESTKDLVSFFEDNVSKLGKEDAYQFHDTVKSVIDSVDELLSVDGEVHASTRIDTEFVIQDPRLYR